MTSEEPSRLGIHHLLPYGDFTDRGVGVTGLALEVEFHRLFKIGHGLLTRRAEAGDIHVESLSHDEFVFAIDAVCHCFHGREATTWTLPRQRNSFQREASS